MKKLAKLLNNFKLTAIVVGIIQVVGVLAALGGLVCYTFSGGSGKTDSGKNFLYPAFYYQVDNPVPQILGMIYFLIMLIAIIAGIMVAYRLVPFIRNKEKMAPSKGIIIAGSAIGILHVITAALEIVLLVTEESHTAAGFIVVLVFQVLFIAACALMIYPIKRCDYFMPEIKRD